MYRRLIILTLVLCTAYRADAQKKEEGLDYYRKPTTSIPRYWSVTEKKEKGWYRELYYFPEKSLAMNGWYEDEACKIPHGEVNWYHVTRFQKSKAFYEHGKLNGPFLVYSDNGMLSDTFYYENGHRKGIGYRFDNKGNLTDSLNFDGKGNGVQVGYYEDGAVRSAGMWVSDTAKNKRWKYYYRDGTLQATDEYLNDSLLKSTCFDKTGQERPGGCVEQEAIFGSDENAWGTYVSKHLNPEVPVRKKAPAGTYTVVVQFAVNGQGEIENIKPLTSFGFGMEDEVVRMLKKSPKWNAAIQHGETVNAYRLQPITFQVVEE